MGAFIGYGHVGVWANNQERNDFLDWYANHRCRPGDATWEYCKSEGHRWTGCCIELADLVPRGQRLIVTDAEHGEAAKEHGPNVAKLLRIIAEITSGEWQHVNGSREAENWRDAD
jgi:hypothetical protein